ncbi:hypothetical protein H6P81_003739 [Aristolochia fimbriata]|uniref:Uncharacterized protein n=1 Tax=Aristolochia fimbriata TaxID=158543 RepID=A0AAV7FEI3_ARIFI|nr:hypothetical protein H6P81_003739 [Aristolochia fimbriata]
MPSSASCGFLSVRDSPDNEEERLLRELSQLLDVYDAHIPRKEELLDQGAQANIELATMSERFMGMKAAMLTTCPEVDIFGRKLGFRALSFDQLMDLPDAFSTATRLMQYLGFSGGEVLEKSDYDLVFVRISPSGNARDQLDWLNALVGGILQVAEPGSGTPVTGTITQCSLLNGKDMAETFSFEDFQEHGNNLAIVADRFLHEVAFRLWKAPKYGA